jgi:hypothetical protein
MTRPKRPDEQHILAPIAYTQLLKAYPELMEMNKDDARQYREEIKQGQHEPAIKKQVRVYPTPIAPRLMVQAAMRLMENDGSVNLPEGMEPATWEGVCNAHIYELYTMGPTQYKAYPARYLAKCKALEIRPYDNKVQRLLRDLCPVGTKMHLYIGAYETTEPSHYIALKQITHSGKTYFVPDGTRVYALSVMHEGKATRNGILAQPYSTSPGESIMRPYAFSRLITGGIGVDLLRQELEISYELQRQLTHAILTGYLSDSLPPTDKVNIRLSTGRLGVKPLFDFSDPACFSGATPAKFKSLGSYRYAAGVDKFACTIYADATDEKEDIDADLMKTQPRLILASLRPRSNHTFTLPTYGDGTFSDSTFYMDLCTIIARYRLFPYLGIREHNSRSITFYLFNYDHIAHDTNVIGIGNKKEACCQDLPYVIHFANNTYAPSFILALGMKQILLETRGNKEACNIRRDQIYYMLKMLFRVKRDANTIRKKFSAWGIPFEGDELEQFLLLYRARFGMDDETPQ